MNAHPVEMLAPVFEFLDSVIAEHGHILFIVFAYVALAAIAWILSGGLRRRSHGQPHIIVAPFFMIRPPAPPPPDLPPTFGDDRWDGSDDHGEHFRD